MENFTEEEFFKLTLEEIEAFYGDINKIKIRNDILIFYLIKKNKIEFIENLIDVLDLNIKDGYGYTPLLEACYYNNFEVTSLILDKLKVSKETLSREINVKCKINFFTPLSWACRSNNFEMIELLLGNGAIPEVDEEGNYVCLRNVDGENKEKLRDFIFKFQTQNIKKVK